MHKVVCGMVQAGGKISYTFATKHVSAAVDSHHAQLRRELEVLNPEGLRALDLEEDAAMQRLNIVPKDDEVRPQVRVHIAESNAARNAGDTYHAARFMHDAALVYLRAQWWLDAKKVLFKCTKLLKAHVDKHGTNKPVDDMSGYTALHHAVYSNAATVEKRLDPIISRDRIARSYILDEIKQARNMMAGSKRARCMLALKAKIQAECVTLTEHQSWGVLIDMQQNLIFLEYDIASFEKKMEDLVVVQRINEYVCLVESILSLHKDSIDPARYDAHLKLFAEFRSELDKDGRVHRQAARTASTGPGAATRSGSTGAGAATRSNSAQ